MVKEKKENGTKNVCYINFGEEDEMEICGYVKNSVTYTVVWIFYILSFGLLRLVYHWYPRWRLFSTHKRCSLKDAQKVLVTENFQGQFKSFYVEKIHYLSVNNALKETVDEREKQKMLNIVKANKNKLSVYLADGSELVSESLRILYCKNVCYVWNENSETFVKLSGLEKAITLEEFHNFTGQSEEQQLLKQITYGKNEIKVPRDSIFRLFILEALNPFYVFQLFTIIVWLAEYYYYYTVAIFIMSSFGISSSILQTRQNQNNLRGSVQATDKIKVQRTNGIEEEVHTWELVPGDVIILPCHGCTMHCDAILLSGNCIVNESMLTGESVPVTKTPIPKTGAYYNGKEDAKHTLFSGTKIIQTRYYGGEAVKAVVIRTGYLTAKGEVIRSIMYPPPADFKFDQDSYKFIIILSVICAGGLIYTIISKSTRDNSVWDITIKTLDLITIAIPPALPAAMTVGKLYALSRLKKLEIFCVNSRVINVSGSVNCVCFDKTGTLTEDGLDLWGVITIEQKVIKQVPSLGNDSPLFRAMLTCHSLTLIDGNLIGDPLDLKMFESTDWILEEPQVIDYSKYDLLVPTIVKPKLQTSDLEIGILRQFQFSSTLQRMSVIVKPTDSENFVVYVKGSPETIASLSKASTIPFDYLDNLKTYTEQGYRVIALATRTLPGSMNYLKIQKMSRDETECDLNFVGLLVLENRLKSATRNVIKTLQEAAIKTIMITGDNLQTAVSVARECGVIKQGEDVVEIATAETSQRIMQITTIKNETVQKFGTNEKESSIVISPSTTLAINGHTWATIRNHFPDLVPKIVTHCSVYARMSNDQKQQVILELQRLGLYVAMCGDGANDCGALKAAHVGISLSEAESSIASPFISRKPDVSCVVDVVKEGRAALVTSFGVFKFMICYSLAEFSSVIILYGIDCNLTSFQFLYVDIFLVLNFAFFFGKTGSNKVLFKDTKPLTTLLGFVPLSSMVANLFFVILFQIIAYYLIQTFDWFEPFVYNTEDTMYFYSYENYAVFTVSMFQYITMAVVFSKGKPHRKPIYTNYLFMTSIVFTTLVCVYVTLKPMKWMSSILDLRLPPSFNAAYLILGLAVVNFLLALVTENVLIDILLAKKILPYYRRLVSKNNTSDTDSAEIAKFNNFTYQTTRL